MILLCFFFLSLLLIKKGGLELNFLNARLYARGGLGRREGGCYCGAHIMQLINLK